MFFIAAFVFSFFISVYAVGQEYTDDALVLYRQGEYDRAVEITRAEIAVNPANLDAFSVLGWSLIAMNKYAEALEHSRQALQVSRYDHRIVLITGEAYYELGEYENALQYLQDYTVLAPSSNVIDEVYYLIGESHLALGEYHRADIALSMAVRLSENRAEWWARLGYAREQVGSFPYAQEAYEEALRLYPGLIEARRGIERISG